MSKPSERAICPRCGKEGSGMFAKWVLNEQKKRYFPYYYFAHSHSGSISWCYIRKKEALAILHSPELLKKYKMFERLKKLEARERIKRLIGEKKRRRRREK